MGTSGKRRPSRAERRAGRRAARRAPAGGGTREKSAGPSSGLPEGVPDHHPRGCAPLTTGVCVCDCAAGCPCRPGPSAAGDPAG